MAAPHSGSLFRTAAVREEYLRRTATQKVKTDHLGRLSAGYVLHHPHCWCAR